MSSTNELAYTGALNQAVMDKPIANNKPQAFPFENTRKEEESQFVINHDEDDRNLAPIWVEPHDEARKVGLSERTSYSRS